MPYAFGWVSRYSSPASLSTQKHTMGINSSVLYAATQKELNKDTPE
jgi:hypothetical protein